MNQLNNFISELKMGIAERDELVAEQGEVISGLKLLNKGLNKLCDSQSACIREVRDDLREPNDIAGCRITPVLVFWTGRALYWVKFAFETGFELASSCVNLPCYASNRNRNVLDFMK
jgi:hypothetical protein